MNPSRPHPAWTAAWHAFDLAPLTTGEPTRESAQGPLTCMIDFPPLLIHWDMHIVARSDTHLRCRFAMQGVEADAQQLLAEGDSVRLQTGQSSLAAVFERLVEARSNQGEYEQHLLFRILGTPSPSAV